MTMLSRALRVLLAALVVGMGAIVLAPPAGACACGAAPTSDNRPVTAETALVVFDGRTERIDMVMRLDGSTRDAGWIMPTPTGTQLALGDDKALVRLADATKPVRMKKYDWTPKLPLSRGPGSEAGAAAPAGARVTKVTEVGPFRVTTLEGSRAEAVNDWLRDNGYATRDDLLATFQSYLDRGWGIQAVKLLPGRGNSYDGDLPALRMTFPTTEAVYPIQLSQHARARQQVRLYIAAPHRMDIAAQAAPQEPLTLRFAGRLDPGVTGLEQPMFVTAYRGNLSPHLIRQDFTFTRAKTDDAFVETYTVTDDTPGEIPGLVLTAGAVLVPAIAMVVGLLMVAREQRRSA